MRRSGWRAGAKSLATATAMVCIAVLSSTSAEADYSYTFSIDGVNDGIIGPITGSFTTSSIPNSSITPLNAPTVTLGSYSFNKDGTVYSGNSGSIYIGPSSIYFDVYGPSSSMIFSGGAIFTDTTISAPVNVAAYAPTSGSTGYGLFEAILDSGPSGGGGSGGGSGGAPSPEVNASLGLLLAGATFVFLRRKRGDREATAA